MSKKYQTYICSNCTYQSTGWIGVCPNCENWNSFKKEDEIQNTTGPKIYKLSEIETEYFECFSSGVRSIDKIWSGGIKKGSITLLGGEPGVGKSTLMGWFIGEILKNNKDCKILYATGEESISQVAARMKRINVTSDNLYIVSEADIGKILKESEDNEIEILIIDSIQTLELEGISGRYGSTSLLRDITHKIITNNKSRELATILIGHITKNGDIAGPKTVEHMVDSVLLCRRESDKRCNLYVKKNRYGCTGLAGRYELHNEGIRVCGSKIDEEYKRFETVVTGRAIGVVWRNMSIELIEVTTVFMNKKGGSGKIIAINLDQKWVQIAISIIKRVYKIDLEDSDLIVRINTKQEVDGEEILLTLITSIISSYEDQKINKETVFAGKTNILGSISLFAIEQEVISKIKKIGVRNLIGNIEPIGGEGLTVKKITHAGNIKEIISQYN